MVGRGEREIDGGRGGEIDGKGRERDIKLYREGERDIERAGVRGRGG